jgi:DNA-binding XRE family transcriptional regulator
LQQKGSARKLSSEMDARAGQAAPVLDPAAVLAKALLRAGDGLGLSQRELAQLIGVSEATVSRVRSGRAPLSPESKEGELALLVLRAFRSLDALLGGDVTQMAAWMRAHNLHLAAVPATRMQTIEGLVHVVDYLDAMRGKL